MKLSRFRRVLGLSPGGRRFLLSCALAATLAGQSPEVSTVENLASGERDLAPGVLARIVGENLVGLGQPATVPISVLINGASAPVLKRSPLEIEVQVPTELTTGSAFVEVETYPGPAKREDERTGLRSDPFMVTLDEFAPGLFSRDFISPLESSEFGAIFRLNGQPVDPKNPATPGEKVWILATGLGPTVPQVPTGVPSPGSPPAITASAPSMVVGQQKVTVQEASLQPYSLGRHRVFFTIPESLPEDERDLALTIGGRTSPSVLIPLKGDFSSEPKLSAAPERLTFALPHNSARATQGLIVENDGGGSLIFEAGVATNSGGDWLSVRPVIGQITAESPSLITVGADPFGLEPGTYLGEVRLADTGSDGGSVTPVTMVVSARRASLRLSQTGLTFRSNGAPRAGTPPSQSVQVLLDGRGDVDWKIETSTLSGGNWLSASPVSGSGDAPARSLVDVMVDAAGLAPGTYYGQVRVDAPAAAGSPQFVTVVLDQQRGVVLTSGTSNPEPLVEPTGLVLVDGRAGISQALPEQIEIHNLTNHVLPFTSESSTPDGGQWLLHSPAEGSILPGQPISVGIRVDSTGLTPGLYRGELTFSFGEAFPARRVDVLLVLGGSTDGKETPTFQQSCAPTELAPVFRALETASRIRTGRPTPIVAEIVDSCGIPIEQGSVIVTFSGVDSPPLPLAHAGGGRWSGTWNAPAKSQQSFTVVEVTATDAFGINGSFGRMVSLQAQSTEAPQVRPGGIVNGASFAPGPIAPGSIVSVFGEGLSGSPSGTGASGFPLPTELDDVRVTLGGVSMPLLYASDRQVNAIVPFELADRLNENLPLLVWRGASVSVAAAVTLTAAAPGVFSSDGTPGGLGTVLDSNSEAVNRENPVGAGDVIQIFCTGLGGVNPAVPTGEAAPVSPLSATSADVSVKIGGEEAVVLFAGLTPGLAGLYQVNATVPAGLPAGDAELVVSITGVASPVVTVPIR